MFLEVAAVAATFAAVIGQTDPAPGGVEYALLQYGVLGIFAVVAGVLIRKFLADQRADLIEARAQRDAMIKDLFELVIPAVSRATEMLDRVERRFNEGGR